MVTPLSKNMPNDMMAQMLELDISAVNDDISSIAPSSVANDPHKSHAMPFGARKQFHSFAQNGKKSPIGRTMINRMTANLNQNKDAKRERLSTMLEQPAKTPRAPRDMWKPADGDSDDEAAKKTQKAHFKTKLKVMDDCEVFETEDLDSSEDSDDEDLDQSLDPEEKEEREKEKQEKRLKKQ